MTHSPEGTAPESEETIPDKVRAIVGDIERKQLLYSSNEHTRQGACGELLKCLVMVSLLQLEQLYRLEAKP